MATKYKATGCTKFLLVLLILLPLSYFGARIITGDDPLSSVYPIFQKDKVEQGAEMEKSETEPIVGDVKENEVAVDKQKALEEEVERLKEELRVCREGAGQ